MLFLHRHTDKHFHNCKLLTIGIEISFKINEPRGIQIPIATMKNKRKEDPLRKLDLVSLKGRDMELKLQARTKGRVT